MRATIIAHFREEEGSYQRMHLSAQGLHLPGTVIGQGAVVTAGSVVTQSVPPMTVVQGNPAKAIATVGLPLKMNVSVRQFSKRLKPLVRAR
jgi:serine acetyltransferase